MTGGIIIPGGKPLIPDAPKGLTQVFAMASPRGYTLQLLVTPEGHFVINSGDVSQPPGHRFIMNLWARADMVEFQKALGKILNHGKN
jgi:hypothetical protein